MNNRTTPKDFFLHLGATIALYAAVIALINLSLSIVDYLRPDALASYFSASSIAWPISMLVVLLPLLYVLEWVLVRDIRRTPEKRELWIRKWRIYLTLFLSGATVIGDLIALVNTYLSGEITSRFVYKVLAVLLIAGVVFVYYLLARISDEAKGRGARRAFAAIGIVLALAAIVIGFVIVGSPTKQRDIRFDNERVNDLSNIQNSVAHFWQEFGKVPSSLSEMPEYMSGLPKDPVTGVAYRYETVSSGNSFKLCAIFSEPSSAASSNYPKSVTQYTSAFYNWDHGSGEACFTRVINPVDFPPLQNPLKSQ